MRKVTLLFPDLSSLWSFAQTLQADHVHVDSTERKITCSCSDVDITRALIEFKAKIIDEVEERTNNKR